MPPPAPIPISRILPPMPIARSLSERHPDSGEQQQEKEEQEQQQEQLSRLRQRPPAAALSASEEQQQEQLSRLHPEGWTRSDHFQHCSPGHRSRCGQSCPCCRAEARADCGTCPACDKEQEQEQDLAAALGCREALGSRRSAALGRALIALAASDDAGNSPASPPTEEEE